MKRIALWVGIPVLILILAAASLPFLIDANQFRPRLETELTQSLGRDIKIGELKLSVLSGSVSADELSIADDPAFSRNPFLHTRSVDIGVELWPLISSRKLHVTRLVINQPAIQLLRSASGNWNFSSLGGKAPAKAPRPATPSEGLGLSVSRLEITNGRLSLADATSAARAKVLESVNIKLENFSTTTAFPFTLIAKLAGGGDIQLAGNAGPINATDAAETPARLNVKVSGFDLGAAAGGASGVGGIVQLNGVAASNGRNLNLSGHIKVDKLKLARNGSAATEPVEFDFALEHNMRTRSAVLRRGDIHIGSARAVLAGNYSQHGESTSFNMNLDGPAMPVPQLAAMLPSMGIVLPAGSSLQGGTANAKLSFVGPIEALVISGTLGLTNTKLAGFNLGSKMSEIEKFAGMKSGPDTEIQALAANVRMAPEGSTISDIKLAAPALGDVSGAGTVSPAQALDFRMTAVLHTSGMAGVLSHDAIPFRVEGTAANPVFKPDMRAFAAEQVKGLTTGDVEKAASGLKALFGKKK